MKTRGFTLIELMIVIAIIGIIAAIVLPMFYGKHQRGFREADSPPADHSGVILDGGKQSPIPSYNATPVPATPASSASAP